MTIDFLFIDELLSYKTKIGRLIEVMNDQPADFCFYENMARGLFDVI